MTAFKVVIKKIRMTSEGHSSVDWVTAAVVYHIYYIIETILLNKLIEI